MRKLVADNESFVISQSEQRVKVQTELHIMRYGMRLTPAGSGIRKNLIWLNTQNSSDVPVQVIKKVFQNARIGCGLDYKALMDDKWINVLFSELHPGDIDFYCFHTYTAAPEFQYFPNVRRIRERLDSFSHESTEIWQGESGCPTWFPEGVKNCTLAALPVRRPNPFVEAR